MIYIFSYEDLGGYFIARLRVDPRQRSRKNPSDGLELLEPLRVQHQRNNHKIDCRLADLVRSRGQRIQIREH